MIIKNENCIIDTEKRTFQIGKEILSITEAETMKRAVERYATFEYLFENNDLSEKEAWVMAGKIRELIIEKNYSEDEAINLILNKYVQ